MKKTNYLNRAYKEALSGMEAPLNEVQWDRIQAALPMKKERKGIPFFWVLALVLGSSAGTWWFTYNHLNSNRNKSRENNIPPVASKNTENIPTAKAEKNLHYKTALVAEKYKKPIAQQPLHQTEFARPAMEETMAAISELSALKNDNPNADIIQTETSDLAEIMAITPSIAEIPVNTEIINIDSPEYKTPMMMKVNPKVTLSLSAGFAGLNNRFVSLTESAKQHKDSRLVFEENNRNTQSRFVQLGVKFQVLHSLELGFASGIQWRQNTTRVDFNYALKEIPFREQDGTIIGYVPDSSSPEQFSYRSTNTVNYATIPLCFQYPVWRNNNNELLLNMGLQLLFTMRAKGTYFAINNPGIISWNKSMLNTMGIGPIAGLEYARKLHRDWWLGVAGQWQQNTQTMDNQTGKIKSSITGINTQLVLKYKI